MQQQEQQDFSELFLVQCKGIFLATLTKERACQLGGEDITNVILTGSLPDSASELFVFGRTRSNLFEPEGVYLTRSEAEDEAEIADDLDLAGVSLGQTNPFTVRSVVLVR